MRRETKILGDSCTKKQISIHSLHAEGDTLSQADNSAGKDFNPLPPCGGRRLQCKYQCRHDGHFNPLPPCGGRPLTISAGDPATLFQSTPSMRRETDFLKTPALAVWISIHSLHAEGDRQISNLFTEGLISIHSLHAEGDAVTEKCENTLKDISIHSLHAEGDTDTLANVSCSFDFNPLPPCGGRPQLHDIIKSR